MINLDNNLILKSENVEYDNKTLKEYLDNLPAFAEMYVDGFQNLEAEKTSLITIWGNGKNLNVGGFECEPSNNRIKIPANTCEYIELFGQISGSNNILSYLTLKDENNQEINDVELLIQPGGNKYFAMPLGNRILKIPDKTKNYYVQLSARGYQENANFNTGFGNTFSFIGVKKIK